MSVIWTVIGLGWFVRDLLVENDDTAIPRFVIGSVFLLLGAVSFLAARRIPPGRSEPDDGTNPADRRPGSR